MERRSVHAEFSGELFERIAFIDVAVRFEVVEGKAVGASPIGIFDVFILVTVAGFEHIEHFIGLRKNRETDIVASAAFVRKAFALFIDKDDLVGAVDVSRRILRQLSVF